jgi:hypothetical protein
MGYGCWECDWYIFKRWDVKEYEWRLIMVKEWYREINNISKDNNKW